MNRLFSIIATGGLCALTAMFSPGCSSDAGTGTVAFSTWGEEYIEQEIPKDDVADGWTIRYSRFLVVLQGIRVADTDGKIGAELSASKLFDLTKPGVKSVVSFPGLEAKAWERVSYEIAPATGSTETIGTTDQDKALMVSSNLSLYVEGSATKDSVTKTFAWGFSTHTLFDRCTGQISGKDTEGVVVTNGGTDDVQLTIHGDHLFYDDLQAPDAKLRFDSIAAADANGDGAVTLEELGAVKLAAIPKAMGPYGTGSAAGINDLGAFVTALTRNVGHFRGEGECFARAK
jgi:hypothetical protein